MTIRNRIAYFARTGVATALVATLVFAFPVYGVEADTSTPPTDPVAESPANTPSAPPAATIGPVTIGPGPSSESGSSSSSRSLPEPSVIGDAGVNQPTKEFRAQLAAKQAEVDAFTAQLDELDRELAIASEAYNEAADKLDAMNRQVESAESDLGAANAAYDSISAILDDQLDTMYRSGTYSPVAILLDSKSLSDFLSRVKFLNTIGTDSAQALEEYTKTQAELELQLFKLKNAKRLAESLEFELKARKIEVQLRITERQELFATAQADLLSLLNSQADAREAVESALLKEILAGASKAGVTVVPGTPVETVLRYHGVPYLWGGETPAGFDCSGLILYVMRQHGVLLPHYSGSQFLMGEKVSAAELQPGDAVFFGSPIHHVGMYIGGGYYVHAPRTGDFVKISPLGDRSDFAGARRYAWQPRVGPVQTAVSSAADALSTID